MCYPAPIPSVISTTVLDAKEPDVTGPDDQQPVTDEPPTLDIETLDDLDPRHDPADIKGGAGNKCDTCTRTCFAHS